MLPRDKNLTKVKRNRLLKPVNQETYHKLLPKVCLQLNGIT